MSLTAVETRSEVGDVVAFGTHGRGLNVEELAAMALPKIIHVADTAAPALKEQARMFQEQVRQILIKYMHQAIVSDRTTLHNNFNSLGMKEAADVVLKI